MPEQELQKISNRKQAIHEIRDKLDLLAGVVEDDNTYTTIKALVDSKITILNDLENE